MIEKVCGFLFLTLPAIAIAIKRAMLVEETERRNLFSGIGGFAIADQNEVS